MTSNSRRTPTSAWLVAASLLAAHVLTLARYGIFRDEFYYLANARRLAWGYVDHPPLVAALAWLIEHTLGTSVYALRAPMLITLAAVLAAMAALVRLLGGGGAAVAVAWLAFALSPYYLYAFHYLSMNAPEVLWWTLAALLLARATGLGEDGGTVPSGSHRAWLLFGLVMGLAFLTKVSGLVWGAALAAGVVASPARRRLAGPAPWLAVTIAALMFLPHVIWQASHGWPTVSSCATPRPTRSLRWPQSISCVSR
jgi:4-amino-4-deoxy-L-arabinose transferase-like glycosyltransferase